MDPFSEGIYVKTRMDVIKVVTKDMPANTPSIKIPIKTLGRRDMTFLTFYFWLRTPALSLLNK